MLRFDGSRQGRGHARSLVGGADLKRQLMWTHEYKKKTPTSCWKAQRANEPTGWQWVMVQLKSATHLPLATSAGGVHELAAMVVDLDRESV